MDLNVLLDGYKSILKNLYTPKEYYKRLHHFLKGFEHKGQASFHFELRYLQGLFLSILKLGMIGKERIYFWKLFFWTLIRKPKLFSLYILYAIYGFHFRKIFEV